MIRPNGDGQTPYTYLFVRKDLTIEAQLVQSSHAALEMGLQLLLEKKPIKTSFLILLAVKDQDELLAIKEKLEFKDIEHHMFYEPDYNLGYTAICTEPVYNKQRNFFKKFDLWKQ